jgi:hypothetical protein
MMASTSGTVADSGVFRQRTVVLLVVLCAVSLAVSLVVRALSDDLFERRSHRADAFSRSSIGHHALVQWLGASGVDVVVSRHDSASHASPSAPLMIAEPAILEAGATSGSMVLSQGLADMARSAEARGAALIVVLPKWRGRASARPRGWNEDIVPLDASKALAPLGALLGRELPDELLARADIPASACSGPGGGGVELAHPQLLGGDLQLVPLVSCDGGTLVASVEGRPIYVIADPDLLNTHGIARGTNSALLHALIVDRLGARALVVDEMLHGHAQPPSLWRELSTFPLLPVTLHVLALTALAIWASSRRFGKPAELPPRLPPGKQAIVDSTAQLLVDGQADNDLLEPYYRMSVRRAAAACSVAGALDVEQQAAQLERIARARGVSTDLAAVRAAMAAARGDRGRELRVMSDLYRWRQELEHGSR